MGERLTFTITEERHKKIIPLIKNPETITSFVNNAIDHEIHNRKTRFMSDFIYYLGFPTLAFLGLVFLSLTFMNLFFYVLTVILGSYIVVLFFLFYNKYHKNGKEKR